MWDGWGEILEGRNICVHIADSLHCTVEANTTLKSNYPPIKKKKWIFKVSKGQMILPPLRNTINSQSQRCYTKMTGNIILVRDVLFQVNSESPSESGFRLTRNKWCEYTIPGTLLLTRFHGVVLSLKWRVTAMWGFLLFLSKITHLGHLLCWLLKRSPHMLLHSPN